MTPTSLNFNVVEGATTPVTQTFTIQDKFNNTRNIGAWTAVKSTGGAWLTAAPASGASTSATVTVTVNPSTLTFTGSPYTGSFTVSATAPGVQDTPKVVTVTVTVTQPPQLVLNPGPNPTLTFNGIEGESVSTPPSQSVNISNGRAGAMQYTTQNVTPAETWFSFNTPGPFSAPSPIDVVPNLTGLTAGTYNAKIRVTGVGTVASSPQDISIVLVVAPATKLKSTPGPNPTLTFNATQSGANPAKQSVVVENGGGGTMTWSAATATTWAQFSPASDGNGPTTMDITPQTGSLTPGTHTAVITVTAVPADSQTITIQFNISAAPLLSANPLTLNFSAPQGTNPADQQVNVTSCASTGWTTTINTGSNWIELPSGATGPACNATSKITVHVESIGNSLAVGGYDGSFLIKSIGTNPAQLTVNVHMDVTAPAVLSVNPTVLNFTVIEGTAIVPSQAFVVRNAGVGTLNWTADQFPVTWGKMTQATVAEPTSRLRRARSLAVLLIRSMSIST